MKIYLINYTALMSILFQPCNYSADESDSGDNDVSHDYDEKDDLYRYI